MLLHSSLKPLSWFTMFFWLWFLVSSWFWWSSKSSPSFTVMAWWLLSVLTKPGLNLWNCSTISTTSSSIGSWLTLFSWFWRRRSWVSLTFHWGGGGGSCLFWCGCYGYIRYTNFVNLAANHIFSGVEFKLFFFVFVLTLLLFSKCRVPPLLSSFFDYGPLLHSTQRSNFSCKYTQIIIWNFPELHALYFIRNFGKTNFNLIVLGSYHS